MSMSAVLICLAAGVHPIVTSSSDEKLETIKALSPTISGINYKTCTDIGAEVGRITSGKGVDFVINNTGPASVINDIGLLRARGGTVSLVGFLEGFSAEWDPSALMLLMSKFARLQQVLNPRTA